jgi:c(7)-type cytochrome triheme protein
MRLLTKLIAVFIAVAPVFSAQALDMKKGEALVNERCSACHTPGVLGAPKLGVKADWEARASAGYKTLLEHGLKGLNGMPPKGGAVDVSDEIFESAMAFMLESAGVMEIAKSGKPVAKTAAAVKQPAITTEKAVTAKAMQSSQGQKKVNPSLKFNRLMATQDQWNLPPAEDGIHDPEGESVYALQPPKELFDNLPKAPSGNRVNWVKALEEGAIAPRYDKSDASKVPFVMDLNIVREVKGFMPDVVYPHKQHTEWLDCSNCHPDIFIPKKGANQISMAGILMGEKCGVCHGKVAFPVSECRLCHSKNKTQPVGIKK